MSEHSTPEERTELPTQRRMGQIREKGALFVSHEVALCLSLLTGFYLLKWMWSYLYESLRMFFILCFRYIEHTEPLTPEFLVRGSAYVIWVFGPIIFAVTFCIAIVASLTVFLQTNWNIRKKWIQFNWPTINPLTGLTKMFSVQSFVSTGKAIVKLCLILPIGYYALKAEADKIIVLMHTSLETIFHFVGAEMGLLFWKIFYVLVAIAIFDYFWGKYRWFRQNKMTKPEVKDERKAVEGDEVSKRQIMAKGRARILSRLGLVVPKADVVVTNPTHYAVALKYDRKNMKAPKVVAKGKDFIALKIREIAREHGVPVLERKQLARSLYGSVEVGKEIPFELYKAVAEVLAYVYRLKNPWAGQAQQERR